MKITYLKLQNFANIYAAMGKKTIEIDFSKSKNKIVLLVGGNGTGKTSILSELHPFAYSGNGDVRNNTSLIMPNTKGYKEIHIQDGDDVYVIKHHYTRDDKSTTLKSFIYKNDEDLNPNGNVTSFKTVVEEELDITTDHIKLLRLGSNVSGFIDMKSTERKSYVSNLLKDIDVYTKLYKKVSDDVRVLNSSLNITTGKINRLNIADIELLQDKIKTLKKKLKSNEESRDKIIDEIGKAKGRISSLVPQGVDTLNREIEELVSNRVENTRLLEKINSYLDSSNRKNIKDSIDKLEEEYTRLSNEKNRLEGQAEVLYDQLSNLLNQKVIIMDNLSKAKSGEDVSALASTFARLDVKVKELDKFYTNKTIHGNREIWLTLLNTLIDIEDLNKTIQTFSRESVSLAIALRSEGANVAAYVRDELMKLSAMEAKTKQDNTIRVLFRPINCPTDKCPYYRLHEDANRDREDVINTANKKNVLLETESVDYNINSIISIIKTSLSSLPAYTHRFLNWSEMSDKIAKGKVSFNETAITSIISEVEEYEDYLDMKAKRDAIHIELVRSKDAGNIENINKELSNVEIAIGDTKAKHEKATDAIAKLSKAIDSLKTDIDIIKEYNDYKEKSNTIMDILKTLEKDIADKEKLAESTKSDMDFISSESYKLEILNKEIEIDEKEVMHMYMAEREYNALTEELAKLQGLYDNTSLLRKALSSSKGMPLYLIQIYFKSSRMYINELLDIVYGGRMQIKDFSITENEFSIPYTNNGVDIDDVIYVSQGEKSFFTIAISFALMVQSTSRYNIPLLDEPDSALDVKNRALFLDIIERQLSAINAEQLFLITHNDMFDNYPVDIIMTSPMNINTKGRTILFKND